MLFTTFLLATAIATATVLGAMLFSRREDKERTRVPLGLMLVAVVAVALTALGLTIA